MEAGLERMLGLSSIFVRELRPLLSDLCEKKLTVGSGAGIHGRALTNHLRLLYFNTSE